jgi:uncharacterized protein (AIM24 family)
MADYEMTSTIKIIGTESQTIHIILKKNEKININKNYILYASSEDLDEIVYKNVDSLIRQNTQSSKDQPLKKVENESIVRLKNKENNIEYIGLSKGGKILKITPILYSNLYVKMENILAFNDGIELLKDKDIDLKMNKLIQRNNIQFGLKDLMDMYLFNKSEFCLVKSKLSSNSQIPKDPESLSLLNISSYINDFAYISGKKNLIEKRLGENETMAIMANSLVAFEQSITFNNIRKTEKNNKYVNNLNDIIVEGPGLIIFELAERKMPMSNPMGNRIFIILTVVLFLVEILAQIFVHYNLRP